jgi:DNA-binding NarL/FixJ family response regulator
VNDKSPIANREFAPNSFSVAIIEDHPEFRETLSAVLGQRRDVDLLAVCKDLPAGMKMLEQHCPDVLLVDLGLPSGSGLTLIREAQRRWGKRCNTAVLTVTGNEEHLLTAVGAGAKGYLFKSDTSEEWIDAVRLLSHGCSPLHSNLARHFYQLALADSAGIRCAEPPFRNDEQGLSLLQHVAAGYTCVEAAKLLHLSEHQLGLLVRQVYEYFFCGVPKLSDRELELLSFLNKGIPFKKCADLMGVSESTTKTLAMRAYQKLGANNLQSALYEARAANLIA